MATKTKQILALDLTYRKGEFYFNQPDWKDVRAWKPIVEQFEHLLNVHFKGAWAHRRSSRTWSVEASWSRVLAFCELLNRTDDVKIRGVLRMERHARAARSSHPALSEQIRALRAQLEDAKPFL
jgi:hypothetical protein